MIRDARDEDGPAIAALIEAIYSEYDGVIFDLEELPELRAPATSFARAGGEIWVAEREGRVVGCVGWTPAKEDGGAELKKLYVAASERQSGLGGQLVARVEEMACARGFAFIDFWSDVKFTTAHRFYDRRGYLRNGATRRLHDKSDTTEYYFRKAL